MTQKAVFLATEGDRWYERNRHARHDRDPVLRALNGTVCEHVLEIGCGDGWRLARLKGYAPWVDVVGIDPSAHAVAHAQAGVRVYRGTADALPFDSLSFDVVIFGFCLYLCDRADLFVIAAEADRVLRDSGTLIVYDFHPPHPYRNPYAHAEGLWSYKLDYSRMFTWSPAYTILSQQVGPHPGSDSLVPDNRVGVTVMRKAVAEGWGAR